MSSKRLNNDIPATKLPSERSFGLLFVLVFALSGGYTLYKSLPSVVTIVLFVAAALLSVVTFVTPKSLAPLNSAWFSLGMLLSKIVSPVVLGIIFFLLITPVAVIARIFGRDQLKLRKQATLSCWVDRNPTGPDPQSFKNQF
jgi:hypothetical protein